MNRDEYIATHIDAEPPHLARLDRDTHLDLLYPQMCSGHVQGRVLKMLVRMINPRLILELGTYSSYSAQCLAEGLTRPDAVVHTVELDDELTDFIERHLAECPWRERIVTHTGDAMTVVPALGLTFDLIYIDANKRQYVDYYRLAISHLADAGFIIADNTLWYGKVEGTEGKVDEQTRGIIEFNDLVARDSSVEKVILPIRDGLTLIYKKTKDADKFA